MDKKTKEVSELLRKGIIFISGGTGAGKTTAAIGLVPPEDTAYITFDAKDPGINFAYSASMSPILLHSDVELADETHKVFDQLVAENKKTGRYKALVIEDWSVYRSVLAAWSKAHADDIKEIFGGGRDAVMQKLGYAKTIEKARIASLRSAFPLVVLTAQLRHRYYDYVRNGQKVSVKTETRVPNVTNEAKEASDLFLLLVRMRDQVTPSALVLKQCWPPVWDADLGMAVPAGMLPEKLDYRAIPEEERDKMRMIPIWSIVQHYLKNPVTVGYKFREFEKPDNLQRSIIYDTLTQEEKEQAMAEHQAEEQQISEELAAFVAAKKEEDPEINLIALFSAVKEYFADVTMAQVQKVLRGITVGTE